MLGGGTSLVIDDEYVGDEKPLEHIEAHCDNGYLKIRNTDTGDEAIFTVDEDKGTMTLTQETDGNDVDENEDTEITMFFILEQDLKEITENEDFEIIVEAKDITDEINEVCFDRVGLSTASTIATTVILGVFGAAGLVLLIGIMFGGTDGTPSNRQRRRRNLY